MKASWRSRCATALCTAVLMGCASLPDAAVPGSGGRQRIVRPDASADYDVLVGEFAIRDGRVIEARDAFLRAAEKDPQSARLQAKLARLYAQLDDGDNALAHAERAVELDPDDVNSRLFLAQVYRIRGNFEGMQRALLDETGEPIDTTAALMLYQGYMDAERYPEALALAQQLALQDQENANGYIAIAAIHEKMGQVSEAEASLRQAIELHPDKLALFGRMAQIHRQAGNQEREIEIYREVLEFDPKHYGTLVGLAETLVNADRVDEAIAVYREVVAEYPDDLPATRRLASLYFATEDYAAAAAVLEEAFERTPDADELVYSLGQVQRAAGDDAAALASFRSIDVGHPVYPDARMQIAALLEEQGDFDGAIEQVNFVRQLRPNRNLDFYMAGLLGRAGRGAEGIVLLEQMLGQNPRDEEVLYQLGVLHGMMQETDEALRYMRASLSINPENANALNYVGYTFAEQGENLDEAEELIRRALELRPDDGYITDSLGWVYYMRARTLVEKDRSADAGDYLQQAREHLYDAAELTGGDPVISEHLGDVYLLLDEKSKALRQYEEAVELKPRPNEQPELQQKLEDLRKELGAQ